jgi:hypothetical protein
MAAAARAQARQFSKERMCADTLAVYAELLGRDTHADTPGIEAERAAG